MSWHKYSVEGVEVKVANITNIELDSLTIVLIDLFILIAVVNIITLIKNCLNSGELCQIICMAYCRYCIAILQCNIAMSEQA